MSVTTDAIDAIKRELGKIYSTENTAYQANHLATTVDLLTTLVEKLHARVLFLEQQQSSKENY